MFKTLARKIGLVLDVPKLPRSEKARRRDIVDGVIARKSEGNWALQNAYYTTDEDMEEIISYNKKHSFL